MKKKKELHNGGHSRDIFHMHIVHIWNKNDRIVFEIRHLHAYKPHIRCVICLAIRCHHARVVSILNAHAIIVWHILWLKSNITYESYKYWRATEYSMHLFQLFRRHDQIKWIRENKTDKIFVRFAKKCSFECERMHTLKIQSHVDRVLISETFRLNPRSSSISYEKRAIFFVIAWVLILIWDIERERTIQFHLYYSLTKAWMTDFTCTNNAHTFTDLNLDDWKKKIQIRFHNGKEKICGKIDDKIFPIQHRVIFTIKMQYFSCKYSNRFDRWKWKAVVQKLRSIETKEIFLWKWKKCKNLERRLKIFRQKCLNGNCVFSIVTHANWKR